MPGMLKRASCGVLDACREVEKKLGRERDGRWGPRVIDVDILLYDDLELEGEDLVIPHPRMLERDFVMVPLAELNPPLPLPHEGRGERTGEQDSTGRVRIAFRYEEEEWHG